MKNVQLLKHSQEALAALACKMGPFGGADRYAGSGFAGCFAKMCVSTSRLSRGLLSFDKEQVGGEGQRGQLGTQRSRV